MACKRRREAPFVYAHVHANPLSRTDPMGLDDWWRNPRAPGNIDVRNPLPGQVIATGKGQTVTITMPDGSNVIVPPESTMKIYPSDISAPPLTDDVICRKRGGPPHCSHDRHPAQESYFDITKTFPFFQWQQEKCPMVEPPTRGDGIHG